MGRHPFKESGEKYEIMKLQDQHKEILRLRLLGYRVKDIEEITGYSRGMITIIVNSAVFKEQLEILQAARDSDSIQVSKRIAAMAPLALERVKEILQDPIHRIETNEETGQVEIKVDDRIDPALKANVAKDLLDRAGFKAIERKAILHMTPEEMKGMKEDAVQAGIEDGIVIDVETVNPEEEEKRDGTTG